MRLTFDKLRVTGFKSFGEAQTLLLDRPPGLYFVSGDNQAEPAQGSNGSGKSTLWDALCWALFGRTAKGLRNVDVAPWVEGERTAVRVPFCCDDQPHVVRRMLSPSRILLDKQDIDVDGIERLIGIDFDLFTHTVLLGQGRPLFIDLSAADKMSLFSTVLGLDRWDARSKHANAEAARLDLELERMRGEAEAKSARINELRVELSEIMAGRAAWEADRDQRVHATERALAEARKALAAAEDRRGRVDLKHDGSETEARALEREISTLRDYREGVLLDQADAGTKLKYAARDLKQAQSELREAVRTKVCPTCGQKVSGKHMHSHVKNLNARVVWLTETIELGAPSAVQSTLADLDKQWAAATKSYEKFRKTADDAASALRLHDQQIAEAKAAIAAAQAALDEINQQQNVLAAAQRRLKRALRDAEDEHVELTKRKIKRVRRIARTRYWINGFKELRLRLIADALTELQLMTDAMLPQAGLHGWRIIYEMEKETKKGAVKPGLNVMVQSPTSTRVVKWHSWSEGQAQRLRLVSALALSDVLLNRAGVQPNIEILDEPTQHLSREGVRDVIDMLAERAQRTKRAIYYCDHAAVRSARFADEIRVIHDKKGSYLG